MKPKIEPEFSRPIGLDEIQTGEVGRTIVADDAERAALAARFDLIAVEALQASVRVQRVPGGPLVRVSGRLTADVVQRCVVTLAPLATHIEEEFIETFGPSGYRAPEGEPESDLPEVFDDNGIDVGELAAQLLLLSLDSYPRAPGAEVAQETRPGELGGGRSRPFAALGEMMAKRQK